MPQKTKDHQWINLKLTAKLHARVKEAAAAEDRSVSSWLVRLINHHTPPADNPFPKADKR